MWHIDARLPRGARCHGQLVRHMGGKSVSVCCVAFGYHAVMIICRLYSGVRLELGRMCGWSSKADGWCTQTSVTLYPGCRATDGGDRARELPVGRGIILVGLVDLDTWLDLVV
jgi:hypothetical protein